ncbi:MAG: YceI family protein [Proteobacteria bacterium]|nr:YceI family protein [Pseudomonadota bacterium]
MKIILFLRIAVVLFVFISSPLAAAQLHGAEAEGIFSVILHRGGTTYWLAHNHLMVADAREAKIELNVEPTKPEGGEFRVVIDVQKLIVDDGALHQKWNKRIRELAILNEDFIDLSLDDRTKIRSQMLAEDQLSAAMFQEIKAELVNLKSSPSTRGLVSFNYAGVLRMTIRGKAKEIPVQANVHVDGDSLSVEAAGVSDLTDFGITPISIMLGAIKVLPEFEIYANFRTKLIP